MATADPSLSPSLHEWSLRVVVLAALVVDAVIHLRLAGGYQLAQPAGIGTGNVFRIGAAAAILAALYLLLRGGSRAYAAALAVLGSALVAVVLYRYVDVPGFGPLPPMYEPVWFLEKSLSAVAEAIGSLAAAAGILNRRRPRRAGTP